MLRCSFVAVLLLGLIPALASAQDARERFQRGQVAYDQGDYEVALTEWRAAYELDAQPLIQFNIAQATERLGRLPEAATALDLYLSTASPTDPNQANARARRSALRERLAQTGVRLMGGPSGAAISIDGTEWGLTPRPDSISLDPGSHRIEVTAEGFETFRSTVVVPAGQTVDVTVEMTEREVVAPRPAELDPVDAVDPIEAPAESSGPGAVPWIVAGVGVVLVGAAAALGAVALGKAGDAPGSESEEADSARTLGLTADILGITGAVTISAGLIWYFVGRSSGAGDEESVRISPYAGPDRAGLDAQWSF